MAATAPGAPTGLTATASGSTQINLSWTAPADNGGRVITGYKIEVSSDSASTWSDLVANTSSTTTTYAHTGLAGATTRHYRVSAINTIGTGTASNVDSATTGTAANAAPTASDGTVTATEDTDYTFTEANFNFTDTDVGDALSSVKIMSLPAAGTLQVDGTMIASTDLPKAVTKVDIDASKLTYSPPANANGDDYATFQFKVNDGTDDSDAAFTMTIDVTAVNDPVTGQLAILGDPVFGATLTLDFSAIMDADGLPDLSQSDIGWYHSGSRNPEARLTTSYTLTTKDVGKQLDVDVEYDDDGGEKETLELLSWPDGGTIAAIAPGAPTGLVATASGTTRITLSWTTPASTGGLRHHRLQDRGLLRWRHELDRPRRQLQRRQHDLPAHRAHRRRHPPLPGLGHQHGRHRCHLQRRQRHHHRPDREDQGSQCSGGHRTAAVPVTLSGPTQVSLSVPWETAGLDAVSPDDYTDGRGVLTFAPGATEATIAIPIVDDTQGEAVESLSVVLGPGEGYRFEIGNTALVNILDNDGDDLLPSRATVDGTTLVLTYDEVLDSASTPYPFHFYVTVDDTRVDVDQVSVGGSMVTLALAHGRPGGPDRDAWLLRGPPDPGRGGETRPCRSLASL